MKNNIDLSRVSAAVFDFSGIASALVTNIFAMADRLLSEVTVALGTRIELAPIPLNR